MRLSYKILVTVILCFGVSRIGVCQEVVQLGNGTSLTCQAVRVEGDYLMLQLPQGMMKLPKAAFTLTTQKKYFGASSGMPSRGKPAAAGSPAAQTPTATPEGSRTTPKPVVKVKSAPESDLPRAVAQVQPSRGSPAYTAKDMEFEVSGKKRYKVQVLMPVDSQGKVPDSASDVVYLAPHLGGFGGILPPEGRKPEDFYKGFWGTLRDLVTVHGMTVFTVLFDQENMDVEDHETCYYYKESGSFEVVNQARDKLVADNGLQKRKMLLFGLSAGGTMIERYAVANPDNVAALAMGGGARFEPISARLNFPMLIILTRGDDVRMVENRDFVESAQKAGINALYTVTEIVENTPKAAFAGREGVWFHHPQGKSALDLCEEFLVSVRDQIKQNGRSDDYRKWPYRFPVKKPFDVDKNDGQETSAGKFAYLPSERFRQLWVNSVYRKITIPCHDPSRDREDLTVDVRYPKEKPRAVVFLTVGSDVSEIDRGDLADYFGDRGLICASTQFSDEETDQQIQSDVFLRWAAAQPAFDKLPWLVIGTGTGTGGLIASSQLLADRPDKQIYIYGSPLDWTGQVSGGLKGLKKMNVRLLVNQLTRDFQDSDLEAFTRKLSPKGYVFQTLVYKNEDPKMEYFDLAEFVLKTERLDR